MMGLMKTLIIYILLASSVLAFAVERANFTVQEGKLHKGGTAWTETSEDSVNFNVKMGYKITKKPWAPIPSDALSGDDEIILPLMFKDERGYLELESVGSMQLPKAKVQFVRRLDVGNLKNGFEILVLPKNGKTQVLVHYHPELPSAGWARIKITFISNLPVINGYVVAMDLKK